ncbi:MAG: response regulator [Methylococcaceae bacterium]|nr:response regulator [Methylococcaceae bacterium]
MSTVPEIILKVKTPAVLFVDDEPNVLKSLRRLFHGEGYEIYTAPSGAEGLNRLRQSAVDLIISDMRMPGMNGAEFLAHAVELCPETIRIILTGYADLQSTIDSVNKGRIFSYCNKPWHDEELKLLVRNALEQKRLREEHDRLSAIIRLQNDELKILNEHLEEKVDQRTEQLRKTLKNLDQANITLKKQYLDSIKAFSRIIEMRPGIKAGHSKYIAENAHAVAKKMNMSEEDAKSIFYAGLLLQIGKMTLHDEILAQPFYVLHAHQRISYLKHAEEAGALLKGITQLENAMILIRYQHEYYDGSGSPENLVGKQIPLGSRILTVISEYISYFEGSMTGKPMPVAEVRKRLDSFKGKKYDPHVVDVFFQYLEESQTAENKRPIIEIAWTQLCPGMEIEEISYEGKVYLKDCLINDRMINSLNHLRAQNGISPVIKIRLGVNENAPLLQTPDDQS